MGLNGVNPEEGLNKRNLVSYIAIGSALNRLYYAQTDISDYGKKLMSRVGELDIH